jgi:tRNA threonylcarbamoyladenosine biosynthesis protein TsaE
MKRVLSDETATLQLGQDLFSQLERLESRLIVVYLHGDLGMGKTTLVRALLQAGGHAGKVKSPTYTLVEEYNLAGFNIYHFDLYRLAHAEELEFMGIRDFLSPNAQADKPVVCLVEWPEKGEGVLPAPDLDIYLDALGEGRLVELRSRSSLITDDILKALEVNHV